MRNASVRKMAHEPGSSRPGRLGSDCRVHGQTARERTAHFARYICRLDRSLHSCAGAREFRECYPDVSVIVRLEDTPAALKAVEEGISDLAVIVEDRLPKSLTAHELFQDRLQFVVSPRHPWADKRRISPRDISAGHFLLYARNTVTFRQIEDFLLKMGVTLSSHVEISSFIIMKQLAQLGLGIAIMAAWVAARELKEGSLVARPLPEYLIKRRWSLIHQAGRELGQTERTFLGLCRMAAKTKIPAV